MITRRLLASCYFILLLVPVFTWAANEAGEPAAEQPTPAGVTLAVPAKPIPVLALPAKSAPVPAKPLAVIALPAGSAPLPAKPLAALALPAGSAPLPAKPISVLALPAKSAPVPAKPLAVLALPAGSAPLPAKPLPASQIPAAIQQSAPTQTTPLALALKAILDTAKTDTIDIEAFVREGCQQCDQAIEFLARLNKLQPDLKIVIRDVRKEPAALALVKRIIQQQGDRALDYPAFVVGGQLIIGFSEEASTAQLILDSYATSHPSRAILQNCETGNEPSCGLIAAVAVVKAEHLTVNIFGYSLPLYKIGLPLFTVVMGVVDGLNYASTWVLILLVSLLAPLKNRPLMVAIAGTFVAAQGLVYFILMVVWFNLFSLIDMTRFTQIIVAVFALLAGAVYLKKYLYFNRNIVPSSHEISQPGIYTRIRKIVQTESLPLALLSTALMAVLVQLSEFSYTSIFPALYSYVLTSQNFNSLSNYAYLILYNLAYLLPALVVLILGVKTLSENRQDERIGSLLKLNSGLVLLGLGAFLLLQR